jgi:hypothetical protein
MTRWLRTLGLVAVLAVGAAACSSKDANDAAASGNTTATPSDMTGTTGTHDMSSMNAVSIDTPAATLRATLETLLQEHVYLAGIATGTAIAQGPDSKAFAAAADTLDANTQALADAVGSVYGPDAGAAFLGLWRAHIGMFVDYTVGAATGDDQMKEQARRELDGYRQDFGAFIESATNGGLSKEAVAEELAPHVQTLTAAIDAQAAGSPHAFALLREAASHMPMTADVLAGAIVQQFPEKFAS